MCSANRYTASVADTHSWQQRDRMIAYQFASCGTPHDVGRTSTANGCRLFTARLMIGATDATPIRQSDVDSGDAVRQRPGGRCAAIAKSRIARELD
jgi:hypothetical protein